MKGQRDKGEKKIGKSVKCVDRTREICKITRETCELDILESA